MTLRGVHRRTKDGGVLKFNGLSMVDTPLLMIYEAAQRDGMAVESLVGRKRPEIGRAHV